MRQTLNIKQIFLYSRDVALENIFVKKSLINQLSI